MEGVPLLRQRNRQNEGVPDLKIVLVGKTGAGKSATGNTILGRQAFKEELSPNAVTNTCEQNNAMRNGRRVCVADTPGLFFTSWFDERVQREIEKCFSPPVTSVHVFLMVIRLGTFTDVDKQTVKWFQRNFGQEANKYTMFLFTGGDGLDRPLVEFLRPNPDLYAFTEGFDCHVFNNRERDDATQVTELLAKIDRMVERNSGGSYTKQMYERVQNKIKLAKVTAGAAGVGAIGAAGAAAVGAAVKVTAVVVAGSVAAPLLAVVAVGAGFYAWWR